MVYAKWFVARILNTELVDQGDHRTHRCRLQIALCGVQVSVVALLS